MRIHFIYVLVFFRFMSGMSYQIYGLTSYILMIELFPAKYRGVPCVLDNLIWITGMLLLCLSAYFVRKWRYLFLTVCMPSILTISYYWLMDESVFWLATKNRHEDVNIILAKAYRLNSTAKENQILYHVELQESNEKKWYEGLLKNLKAIFASVTFLYALACGCGLISLASTFYLGSTFASSSFSTNIYLDFFISTLVEVPIIFVGSLAMRYLRRKTAIISSLYLVALVAMPFALIPTKRNNVLRVLNHVYKAVATLYSNFAYSYVSEIYPTKYRQFGMGITVIVSQLHSTISPFIRDWVKSDRLVTMVVFGSLAVLATLAIVFLPETKNRTMIDIKDMMGPCKCAKSTFQKKMDDPSLAID